MVLNFEALQNPDTRTRAFAELRKALETDTTSTELPMRIVEVYGDFLNDPKTCTTALAMMPVILKHCPEPRQSALSFMFFQYFVFGEDKLLAAIFAALKSTVKWPFLSTVFIFANKLEFKRYLPEFMLELNLALSKMFVYGSDGNDPVALQKTLQDRMNKFSVVSAGDFNLFCSNVLNESQCCQINMIKLVLMRAIFDYINYQIIERQQHSELRTNATWLFSSFTVALGIATPDGLSNANKLLPKLIAVNGEKDLNSFLKELIEGEGNYYLRTSLKSFVTLSINRNPVAKRFFWPEYELEEDTLSETTLQKFLHEIVLPDLGLKLNPEIVVDDDWVEVAAAKAFSSKR